MPFFDSLIDRARAKPQTIVLAEGEDPRIIEAARRVTDDGIARCILIGDSDEIERVAAAAKIELAGITIEVPSSSQYLKGYIDELYRLRKHKGMTREEAEQQARDPLAFADLMLRANHADGSIAGARYTTGARVRSALQIVGVLPTFRSVSSFMLMLFEAEHHQPHRAMIFADCGLIIDPDPEQLADIAVATALSAQQLLSDEPRVAMLSFSTDGSASHPHVDKVREATRLARRQMPSGIPVEGEVQLDAAIVPEVAKLKIEDSRIDGRANVLIFPDLDAGNIGYKIAQRFGDAHVIGPVLQGLNRPANDLSRGCTVDDVYYLITLTAIQSLG